MEKTSIQIYKSDLLRINNKRYNIPRRLRTQPELMNYLLDFHDKYIGLVIAQNEQKETAN